MGDTTQSRIWATLAYLGALAFILLFIVGESKNLFLNLVIIIIGFGVPYLVGFLKKDDDLAFFHAKQAFAAWIPFAFGLAYWTIPGQFFEFTAWAISTGGWLIFVIVWVMGLINALRGEENYAPIIGEHFDEAKIFESMKK